MVPAFCPRRDSKASEKKTVRWTVFRERAQLHFPFIHAATSEQESFGSGTVLLGRQKKQVPLGACFFVTEGIRTGVKKTSQCDVFSPTSS